VLNWFTHTLTQKFPASSVEILTSNRMISQQMKVESQGDQPRWCQQSSRYSEKRPTQRELPAAARCGSEDLKGSSLVPLFIGSEDHWLQASVFFHPGHDPHDVWFWAGWCVRGAAQQPVSLQMKYLFYTVICGLLYRESKPCLFCNTKRSFRTCCTIVVLVLLIRANIDSLRSVEPTGGTLAASKTI